MSAIIDMLVGTFTLAVEVLLFAVLIKLLVAFRQEQAGVLDQEDRIGRLGAFVLYFFGARYSTHSSNPVLVLKERGIFFYPSPEFELFSSLRPYFGLTVRKDGSLRWALGDLQVVDDLHVEVVYEKHYLLRSLPRALRHYNEDDDLLSWTLTPREHEQAGTAEQQRRKQPQRSRP